jgi:hypothetical protein
MTPVQAVFGVISVVLSISAGVLGTSAAITGDVNLLYAGTGVLGFAAIALVLFFVSVLRRTRK